MDARRGQILYQSRRPRPRRDREGVLLLRACSFAVSWFSATNLFLVRYILSLPLSFRMHNYAMHSMSGQICPFSIRCLLLFGWTDAYNVQYPK